VSAELDSISPDEFDVIIEPGRFERTYWKDLWRYRELFYFLSWRDVLVRYKQTVIGVAWSVLRPFLTMVVFTVVFGRVAKLPSGGVPYALLVYAAMLPWQFFSNALSESSASLVSNSNLLTKVYFPRLIIPSTSVITSFIDFLISFVILVGLMIWYRFAPPLNMVMLPVFVLQVLALSLGTGLIFAALNVKYRDVRYVIPFIVQIGLYVSPVGFSSAVIPEKWRLLYSANPMVGVIDGFRWCILGDAAGIYWPGFILSNLVILALLLLGIRTFVRMERSFADVI
jgi:lipopolysaccharide transport system permease protein